MRCQSPVRDVEIVLIARHAPVATPATTEAAARLGCSGANDLAASNGVAASAAYVRPAAITWGAPPTAESIGVAAIPIDAAADTKAAVPAPPGSAAPNSREYVATPAPRTKRPHVIIG